MIDVIKINKIEGIHEIEFRVTGCKKKCPSIKQVIGEDGVCVTSIRLNIKDVALLKSKLEEYVKLQIMRC